MVQEQLLKQRTHQAVPSTTKIWCICTIRIILRELERLQEQQILTPLWIDGTAKWCNGFVIVPKPNGAVWYVLGPSKDQPGIYMVNTWGPTLNDILPKLTCVLHNSNCCQFMVSQPKC